MDLIGFGIYDSIDRFLILGKLAGHQTRYEPFREIGKPYDPTIR